MHGESTQSRRAIRSSEVYPESACKQPAPPADGPSLMNDRMDRTETAIQKLAEENVKLAEKTYVVADKVDALIDMCSDGTSATATAPQVIRISR